MAEEVKKTTRGRKPKTKVEETPIVDNNNNNENNELIKKLMAQIEAQNKQMAEMQEQINASKSSTTTIIQQANTLNSKKIKVINLMSSPLNISTEPDGRGRIYSFKGYGDSKLIKYDDLVEIVSSYPNTMENGCAYICDKEAVESLGLTHEYEKLYDKTTMDKIKWLREESDFDLFLGMNKYLQESMALEIAKLLNANERIDYNYLREIKNKTGIDIEEIADNLKDTDRKPTDENE